MVICILWMSFGASSSLAASTAVLGAPSLSPSRIEWGRSVVIVVTALVKLPTEHLPSFVLTLQQINNQGRLISTLGSLRDDGTGADAKANDGIFTLALTLKPPALGDIRLRVSIGMAGNSLPVYSEVSTLSVVAASIPVARITADSIVFETEPGVYAEVIPLVNETIASGDTVTTTIEKGIVSADASRAGVFSWLTSSNSEDYEGAMTSVFDYYDSTGIRWEITSPPDYGFYHQRPETKRLLSSDGKRIALFAAHDGGAAPLITVYDQDGSVVYQVPDNVFAELFKGEISPDGRLLLIVGLLTNDFGGDYVVQVNDLTLMMSSQIVFDFQSGLPAIANSSDGRFLITFPGSSVVLP